MSVKALIPKALARHPLPVLPQPSDKEDRGAVLVVGGGAGVPGAGLLTGMAALRVGAGKLQLAAARRQATALGLAAPEARIVTVPAKADGEIGRAAARLLKPFARDCDAVVVGCGMLDETAAKAIAVALLEVGATAVVDAGALPALKQADAFARACAGRAVLTPHAGEMAAMTGLGKEEIEREPLVAARMASASFQAIVVLKGATTHVVTPDGAAWRHDDGVVGLGTSGSGDVLAGAIGGLLARGASPLTAALWGVWLHAAAGRLMTVRVGELGFLAREVIDALPAGLPRLERR